MKEKAAQTRTSRDLLLETWLLVDFQIGNERKDIRAVGIQFCLHKEIRAAGIWFYLHKEIDAAEIWFNLHMCVCVCVCVCVINSLSDSVEKEDMKRENKKTRKMPTWQISLKIEPTYP